MDERCFAPLLGPVKLLLSHRFVDERHKASELETLLVGIFSADFHSKMLFVELLKFQNVGIVYNHVSRCIV